MSPGLLRFYRWMLPVVLALPLDAQGPPAAAVAVLAPPAIKPRTTTLRFYNEKPVLGLPLGGSKAKAHCSLDGTAFYDLNSSSTRAGQDLFGLSPDGNVKHLLRKLPIDYTNVTVKDFFAGDHQLVTLLEADKRSAGDTVSTRETDYFLSLEDEAGDASDLVQLQLRFRPLKVARFGSGDVVVLGWDEGNLLPMLALVKSDGTIRRFVDFDSDRRGGDAAKQAAAEERATMDMLQGAAFVAYESGVLLTYPGTAKPVRLLSSSGEMRTIPIEIPGGFVLNDVLVSSGRGTLVIRVRQATESKPAKDGAEEKPKFRVWEMAGYPGPSSGMRLREFDFEKPPAADLTCAVNSTLSAVFFDTIPDANHAATNGGAVDPAAAGATQLVVATVRR
jgi:hypothetical protein